MTVTLQPPIRYWRCPSCPTVARTQRSDVHVEMHPCPAFNGINLPLQEVGSLDERVNARHVEVAPEDYVGDSNMGRIASIVTERADGSNDCTVLAPTATARGAVN